MEKVEIKNFNSPDETRSFEKGKVELVNIAGGVVGRATFQPGWKWSKHVKPIAKTEWCEMPHFQYVISGKIAVKMSDGTQKEFGPGDVATIPPGHDGWVVGNEECVAIDFSGMKDYAKESEE